MFLCTLLCLFLAPGFVAGEAHPGEVYPPSKEEVYRISALVELAVEGEYPGTNQTRRGRHGSTPIWNQRTAILYYNRHNVGKPIMWLTLSMGVVGNAKELVSNKKTWTDVWRDANPAKFHTVETYLPRTWSDVDSFSRDMEEERIYVYKPVYGYQGRGIFFMKGVDMARKLVDEEQRGGASDWVVQEFVESFLYNGKKNHVRVVTLLIVQPDGTREFFMYDKMRLYTAPENYDEDRLIGGGGDVPYMLLTNLHQNELYFKSDPMNAGKKFDPHECLFDAQTVLGRGETGGVSFDHVFSESKKMHEVIYSIIGDAVECRATNVSIYGDACFHMMASDVSFDRKGRPYLLEMNHRMGFNVLWTPEEQSEFSNGVAALVKGTISPYVVEDSSMWKRL